MNEAMTLRKVSVTSESLRHLNLITKCNRSVVEIDKVGTPLSYQLSSRIWYLSTMILLSVKAGSQLINSFYQDQQVKVSMLL